MLHRNLLRYTLIHLTALLFLLPKSSFGLIITSVLAGNKKFKTVSFDTKFIKPLTFEKDLPSTEFRRHRTLRPPKFDVDINIPIKLPLEDEYNYEEHKKPVESNLFFQTDEIEEPSYKKHKAKYNEHDQYQENQYAASEKVQQVARRPEKTPVISGSSGLDIMSMIAKSIKLRPQFINRRFGDTEFKREGIQSRIQPEQDLAGQASSGYGQNHGYKNDYQPEFIPGGFINLQLSGPTGGPKATYEDYDREKWAQQLSQTEGAMPYPILNYHQLQNFYGGLGTFTNGLAENRYVYESPLSKLKSAVGHYAGKFHIG